MNPLSSSKYSSTVKPLVVYHFGAEHSYADGALFSYTTTLASEVHSCYFEAIDGSLTARFPESGTLEIQVETSRLPFWAIIAIALGLGLGIFFFVGRQENYVVNLFRYLLKNRVDCLMCVTRA